MNLIDETDVPDGTYYKVIEVANLRNIAIQYKITTGPMNVIELHFYATTDSDADDDTLDDWVDVTRLGTGMPRIFVQANQEEHDIAYNDREMTIAKLKVLYTVSTTMPDNSIKVGWSSDK
jgi:hypothetical protein